MISRSLGIIRTHFGLGRNRVGLTKDSLGERCGCNADSPNSPGSPNFFLVILLSERLTKHASSPTLQARQHVIRIHIPDGIGIQFSKINFSTQFMRAVFFCGEIDLRFSARSGLLTDGEMVAGE